MFSPIRILACFLPLALLQPASASFVHSRRSPEDKSVAGAFRHNFGWPGHMFPADPWGVVMGDQVMESQGSSSLGGAPGAGANVNPGVGNVADDPSIAISIGLPSPTAIPFPAQSYSQPAAAPVPIYTSSTVAAAPSNTTSSVSVSTEPASSASSSSVSKEPTSSSAPAPPPPTSSPRPPPPETTTKTEHTSQPETHTQPPSNPQPTSAPPPPPAPADGQGSSSTNGPTSSGDIQLYLQAHNSIRAQHGAAPLQYDQNLAAKAQQWANNCVFKHSGGSLGPFGENLAAGTGDGYAIPQAIKSWTDEVSQYNPGNPQPSHFTQVVWKGTTHVGCALQNCNGIFDPKFGKAHYYVCEYSPAGNVIGSFAQNVQA